MKLRSCSQKLRVNMLLELHYEVRMVHLKRIRVNSLNDTNTKIPVIECSLNYPWPGADLSQVSTSGGIHISPYSWKGKGLMKKLIVLFPHFKEFL